MSKSANPAYRRDARRNDLSCQGENFAWVLPVGGLGVRSSVREGGGTWPSGLRYQLALTARCVGDYNEKGWQPHTDSPELTIP